MATSVKVTPLVTDEARKWRGWRGGLRPEWEPILVYRKGGHGSFGEYAVVYGVAGLHVEAARSGEDVKLPGNVVWDGSAEAEGLFAYYGSKSGQNPVRFYYAPKASTEERWFWCKECAGAFPHGSAVTHQHEHERDGEPTYDHLVFHPTVKPLALMEWLCRLTETPTKGVVLDPFCGSGSTCVAAKRVGRGYIGIDSSRYFTAIARARLA